MQETNKTNWLAILSLILSILSILCCCFWYAALLIGAAAVILGIAGLRSTNPKQKDAAIAGIVVGAVGVVLALTVAVMRILLYSGLAGTELSALTNVSRFM